MFGSMVGIVVGAGVCVPGADVTVGGDVGVDVGANVAVDVVVDVAVGVLVMVGTSVSVGTGVKVGLGVLLNTGPVTAVGSSALHPRSTMRTKRKAIFGIAPETRRFARDPCFVRDGPRPLLCLPSDIVMMMRNLP